MKLFLFLHKILERTEKVSEPELSFPVCAYWSFVISRSGHDSPILKTDWISNSWNSIFSI